MMKIKFLILALILTSLATFSFGQNLDKETQTALFNSQGFCEGQKLQMEHIKVNFPQLERMILLSKSEFMITFGNSCEALSTFFPKDIKDYLLKDLTDKLKQFLVKDEIQAKEFLNVVRQRAKGEIESPIKELLLAVNPEYESEPAKEFLSGYTKIYRTKGHIKAKGLDISLELPLSWRNREGYRPNIIQFFNPHKLSGDNASFSVMVKDVPKFKGRNLTDKEAVHLFTKSSLAEFAEGGSIVESGTIVLEGQPGGYIISDNSFQRLEVKVNVRTLNYSFYYKGKLIILFCGVSQLNSSDNLDLMMKKYRHLFTLIANSVVLNDKYANPVK